jgi:hypothetical protein
VNTFLSDGGDGSTCQAACLNGGSCSGSKCVCRTGYQGEFCGERTFVLCIRSITGIIDAKNGFRLFNTQNGRNSEI